MSKNVLVIGTGTIGEPLIGLLADHKDSLGLDNVIFFKRTPLSDERGKVESLIRKGAKIVSTADALSEFHQLGFPLFLLINYWDLEEIFFLLILRIQYFPEARKYWLIPLNFQKYCMLLLKKY